MIRRPPRSTPLYSSAASDVYKRQLFELPVTAALASHPRRARRRAVPLVPGLGRREEEVPAPHGLALVDPFSPSPGVKLHEGLDKEGGEGRRSSADLGLEFDFAVLVELRCHAVRHRQLVEQVPGIVRIVAHDGAQQFTPQAALLSYPWVVSERLDGRTPY